MGIIAIVIVLAILGVFCWFLTTLPMPPMFRNLIYAVIAIGMLLWLLDYAGATHIFGSGRFR
jgi:hypothetical protein